MYKTLTLDIETIPGTSQAIRDYYAKSICKDTAEKLATVKAPANYKDQVKIDEYIANAKQALIDGEEQAIEDAVNKTGLDGAFGQIVCIGLALDDAEPVCLSTLDEVSLLASLNNWLNDNVNNRDILTTSIVGHNVASFDLRFLVQRHIVNGIRPHQLIKMAAEAKPWEKEKVYDTMSQWNPEKDKRISLDKLCTALGLPGKGDISGADVWPMVQAGKLDEVAEYCKDDVRKTRDVFKRMTFIS